MSTQDELNFNVKLAVYPLEAIYAACYVFIDRAYIFLDMNPAGDIAVAMKPKTGATAKKFADIEGDFHNELLHQSLRLKISQNSQKIREYVVTQALMSAQPPSEIEAAVAAAEEAPILDEKLEKEIEDLLAELENEKKNGGKAPRAAAAKAPAKHVDLEKQVQKLLGHAGPQVKPGRKAKR